MITFDESVPKTMRKHIKILVPALAIASVALAGCAQPQIKPVATEPDIVSERIASATEKASRALDSISGIEQMRTPLPVEQSYADAPATMQQVITVKWTGPIEQIVQTLAGRAGLSFRTKAVRRACRLPSPSMCINNRWFRFYKTLAFRPVVVPIWLSMVAPG